MTNQVATLKMGQKFKRTPAGEIPVDWGASFLADVADILGGGTPDRLNPEYWKGTIPWATPTDITGTFGNTISKTKEMISELGLKNSAAKLMPPGSVLMTSRATLGNAVINTVPMATNQGFTNFICKEMLHNYFLLHLIRSKTAELARLGAGSTFLEIPKSALRKIVVPIPSLQEQQSIAEFFSALYDAIEKTNSVIAKLRELKSGLMQQLFTKGVANHKKFKMTKLGRIPESWDLQPCEKLCELITVGIVVQPARLYQEFGVPCLRSMNILEDAIADERMVFISREANESHAKSKLKEGDVVAVRTGYPGTSCVVPLKYDGANCVDLVIMRPNKLLAGTFLSRFINSPAGRKQVLQGQGGLAQQHFNVGEVCKMLIPVPPVDEQQEISDVLITTDTEINNEERIKESFESLKKGLMKVLLYGKIRLRT